MTNFRFLHAADIHLDSPLHGLARYDGVPLQEVRGATRAAFDRLIRLAVDEAVDFVVIAGDLYDGDWRDMSTGLYFARAMGVLAAADIPAFVLAGNHDAASVLTKSLPWPANVRVFGPRRPETFEIGEIGVALHGQSFANAHVSANLALAYPEPVSHAFNIGVLHTSLSGHPLHATYAPCAEAELTAKGYDYWALGHVHEFAVVGQRPPIVFPGNLQGRNIREAGAKGAVLVDVQDGAVVDLRHVPLDVVRWARVEADCSGATAPEEVLGRIREALSKTHAEQSDGRPMVVRVVLSGRTALSGSIHDRQSALRDEVRALAAAVSPELWLEKLSNRTLPPEAAAAAAAAAGKELPADFQALLTEAAGSPDLEAALSKEFAAFLAATPAPVGGDDSELGAAARRGDWTRLLAVAAGSLPSRLASDGGG